MEKKDKDSFLERYIWEIDRTGILAPAKNKGEDQSRRDKCLT